MATCKAVAFSHSFNHLVTKGWVSGVFLIAMKKDQVEGLFRIYVVNGWSKLG